MICDLDCAACPYANCRDTGRKEILVAVTGAEPDSAYLDFFSTPTLSFNHKGHSIRFINFSGSNWHIGRKIIACKADMVLNVVDMMNLEHDLLLTSRLIDMDLRTAVLFINYDEYTRTEHSMDYRTFGELTGTSTATLGAYSEEAFSRLLSFVVDSYNNPVLKHVHVPYGQDIDKAIAEITDVIALSEKLPSTYHDRYLAVRLLEDPQYILEAISSDPVAEKLAAVTKGKVAELEKSFGEPVAGLIAKARDGFIRGALQETVVHSRDNSDHKLSEKIDAVLTSRTLGFPILIVVLLAVFQITFKLGAYPQSWIESGISLLGSRLSATLPEGWFSNLIVNGIVQGVGAVLAFLPNIVILFFFLSVLEDSGYMARAAFLMDKVMHRVGLHGRSFIPMLIGFGCNVAAIVAARSIEDRKGRALTMLMIPFMSCSARLPVYMLLVSAFFARQKALVMISIYLAGILLSILFAFIMKRTRWFRSEEGDYVSELPPFRRPGVRNTCGHIWERTSDYLRKITTVILTASVIIWALEYFPAERTRNGADKEESCLAMIGKGMEPVMRPLGFDWKLNVCLLTGLPAKEAIVSTMGILYHSGEGDASLADTIRNGGAMTPATALAFMAFVLLYFPCIATIAALKRELGGRWAAFTVVHSLLLAWIVAFLVFSVASLF